MLVRFINLSILTFTALFFGLSGAMAADCGLFRVVKKDVRFMKQGQSKFKKARINRKVCEGDTIVTGPNSRAKIELADGDEVHISPDTQLVVAELQRSAQNKKVLLDVVSGKIRSSVKRKYEDNKKSHFRVKTKSAVAGVRGTEFLTGYNPRTNQSKVVTFHGRVSVGRMVGGRYKVDVVVGAGEYTEGGGKKSFMKPRRMRRRQLRRMERESRAETKSGAQMRAPASESPVVESDSADSSEPSSSEPTPGIEPKDSSRGPASDGLSDFDKSIVDIEENIAGGEHGVAPDIEFDKVPVVPQLVDTGNILGPPQVRPDNLIDNVIQNPKANVIFNIGVQ